MLLLLTDSELLDKNHSLALVSMLTAPPSIVTVDELTRIVAWSVPWRPPAVIDTLLAWTVMLDCTAKLMLPPLMLSELP